MVGFVLELDAKFDSASSSQAPIYIIDEGILKYDFNYLNLINVIVITQEVRGGRRRAAHPQVQEHQEQQTMTITTTMKKALSQIHPPSFPQPFLNLLNTV